MTMRKAFSLTELLVILGVLSILIIASLPVFNFFKSESLLTNVSEEIISRLRLAQSRTITSEAGSQYGVYFNDTSQPNQYVLFKGSSYSLRDPLSDETFPLPNEIKIYAINLGAGKEVVFEKIDGETINAGSVFLQLTADLSKTRTIYIKNSGQVDLIEAVLPGDAARIKDSRHSHFNLGWSIQNATDLKFYFPSAAQTETVSMASYFNAGKTSFDWSGSFDVDGANQVFQVHTHSLDAFNTSLCIHRDRNNNNNNQEVIVYIRDGGIDKDIAHYLADSQDTLVKGTYATTAERQ